MTLFLTGPGKYSLDHAFGIRLPRPLVAVIAVVATALIVYALMAQPAEQAQGNDEVENPT